MLLSTLIGFLASDGAVELALAREFAASFFFFVFFVAIMRKDDLFIDVVDLQFKLVILERERKNAEGLHINSKNVRRKTLLSHILQRNVLGKSGR